jgi:tripartite-type tricarboxylate transporter receptor subunit TctC
VTAVANFACVHPEQLTSASAGNGSTSHLSPQFFQTMAELEISHIPYASDDQTLV